MTTLQERARRRPGASGLLASAGLLTFTAPALAQDGSAIVLKLSMLVTALALGAVAWQAPWPRRVGDIPAAWRGPLVRGGLALPAALAGLQMTNVLGPVSLGVRGVAVTGYAVIAGAAATLPDIRVLRAITTARLFVLIQMGLLTVVVLDFSYRMDVWVFLTHSARALLHGANPYGLTFPNIYPPDLATRFYGHGVVAHGRVTYGFPYMPLSALAAAVGYVLGDVRLVGILALGALAWVLSGPSASRRSRAYAVLFLVVPSTIPVLEWSWTEALLVAVLALAVWAMRTERLTTSAVFLGLFLVSKQYVVVTLPCLWLLRHFVTRRRVAVAAGTASIVTLPFLFADPHAFWRSVAEFQLVQPFRSDSLSLLVFSVNHTGWPAPAVYNVLPVIAGLLVAVVVALRARPGPAQYATGVGLSLLTTVLLSKQAFMNYYFLIGGAFLIAAWAVGRDVVARAGQLERPTYASSRMVALSDEPRGDRADVASRVRNMVDRTLEDRRFRFLLVGGWNTLFGYVAFCALTLVLDQRLHYLVVLVIGHVMAVSQGFVLHRRFVYRVRGHLCRDFCRFQLMYAGALSLNALSLFALVSAGLPALLAQAVLLTALPVVMYLAHLHFTFHRLPRTHSPAGSHQTRGVPAT